MAALVTVLVLSHMAAFGGGALFESQVHRPAPLATPRPTLAPLPSPTASRETTPAEQPLTSGVQPAQETPRATAPPVPTEQPPTATIALPRIATTTPLPLRQVTFDIDDGSATLAARRIIGEQRLPITNASVVFTNARLLMKGDLLGVALALPGGRLPSGQLLVVARPLVSNDQLNWKVDSITLNDQDISATGFGANMENALNDAFLSQLRGRFVRAARITEGNLHIEALERQ